VSDIPARRMSPNSGNSDTAPITPPVRYTFRGRWRCDLCGKAGPGGADGFNTHYADHHWDYRKDNP